MNWKHYLVNLVSMEIIEGPVSKNDAWDTYDLMQLKYHTDAHTVFSEAELDDYCIIPPYSGSFTLEGGDIHG